MLLLVGLYICVDFPGAPLTNFNDGGGGGPTEVHILYPKKSQLQNLSTQKILAYPKKSLGPFSQPQKIPLFFFVTQKNPGVFHRPKKITLGQNFRPKKSLRSLPPIIKICEWGPWGGIAALNDIAAPGGVLWGEKDRDDRWKS